MHRLYAFSEPMDRLGVAVTAYELWNVGMTYWFKEYRTVAFVGHHATTCVLGSCTGNA